jgi:hypothetical protein
VFSLGLEKNMDDAQTHFGPMSPTQVGFWACNGLIEKYGLMDLLAM